LLEAPPLSEIEGSCSQDFFVFFLLCVCLKSAYGPVFELKFVVFCCLELLLHEVRHYRVYPLKKIFFKDSSRVVLDADIAPEQGILSLFLKE
jgi:hypothetical protein